MSTEIKKLRGVSLFRENYCRGIEKKNDKKLTKKEEEEEKKKTSEEL